MALLVLRQGLHDLEGFCADGAEALWGRGWDAAAIAATPQRKDECGGGEGRALHPRREQGPGRIETPSLDGESRAHAISCSQHGLVPAVGQGPHGLGLLGASQATSKDVRSLEGPL